MTRFVCILVMLVVTLLAGCGGYTHVTSRDEETGSSWTTITPRKGPAAGCYLMTLSPGLQRMVGGYSAAEPVCYVPRTAGSGTQPFFHLANPSTGDHLYTARASEISEAAQWNYTFADTCCYVYADSASGRLPLFRLFKEGTWCHFYTTSESARDSLAGFHGYKMEGVACYVRSDSLGGARVLYRMRRVSG